MQWVIEHLLKPFWHLFITFKTNLFVKDFNKRIKDNIKKVKKLPKIKGIKEIMYPGQNKYQRLKLNSKKKIKISEMTKRDFKILKNWLCYQIKK